MISLKVAKKVLETVDAGLCSGLGKPVPGPACCSVVPTLYRGEFCTVGVQNILYALEANGSAAAPGFMQPEGIVIYHVAGKVAFKKTLGGDGAKSLDTPLTKVEILAS